ncbi:hypothetical protein J2Y48_002475 [Mycoplana sp. BE70]|nr:hypothetical protein [Mycoplana sp. BE70]
MATEVERIGERRETLRMGVLEQVDRLERGSHEGGAVTAPVADGYDADVAASIRPGPLEADGHAPPENRSLDFGDPSCTAQVLSQAMRLWPMERHPSQEEPEGDWRVWLLMGGRGSGKTRAGAEWVHESALREPKLRIALVAETLGDAREVMVDGVSGICRIARGQRPEFEASRRRLVWPNGSIAQIFSSEDPESLRGPQFHLAWCDELHSSIVSGGVNRKTRANTSI